MVRNPWIVVIAAIMLSLRGWIFIPSYISAQETGLSTNEVAAVHEVRISKGTDKFEPAVLKIKVGDTVKWVNEDDRTHVIASIPGQGTNDKELFAPSIPTGKSWSHTFKKGGEYPYFCYIHYVMMGVVIVEGEQAQPK